MTFDNLFFYVHYYLCRQTVFIFVFYIWIKFSGIGMKCFSILKLLPRYSDFKLSKIAINIHNVWVSRKKYFYKDSLFKRVDNAKLLILCFLLFFSNWILPLFRSILFSLNPIQNPHPCKFLWEFLEEMLHVKVECH